MERIILRHLDGSRAGLVEEYPLDSFVELLLGRDPASQVRFDPIADDLVSRRHARIVRDGADPSRFSVVDLDSRNGTFLNRLRVMGTMPLQPGDVIQLGAGGPELRFGLGLAGSTPTRVTGEREMPGRSNPVVGMASDRGSVRAGNEDSVRVVCPADARELARRGLLALVCDGMGGHVAGETASSLAAEVVARRYAEGDGEPGAALTLAVRRANRSVYEASRADSRLAGMGTTCTAVVLRGGCAWCAHVGDSRCYLLRGGELFLMTEDHSVVMALVRGRSLSRDEARRHPDRNVVSRALGSHPEVEIAEWPQPFLLRPGDRLLLCTDGLHDMLGDDELRSLALDGPPQHACERLVAEACARGAPDNVSVVIVELPVG